MDILLEILLALKWRAVKHTAQFLPRLPNSSLDHEVLQHWGPQYICVSEWTPGRFISFLLRRQRQNQSGRRWHCTLGMQIARGYSHKTTLRKLWAIGKGYTLRMFKSYQLLSCIIMLKVWGKTWIDNLNITIFGLTVGTSLPEYWPVSYSTFGVLVLTTVKIIFWGVFKRLSFTFAQFTVLQHLSFKLSIFNSVTLWDSKACLKHSILLQNPITIECQSDSIGWENFSLLLYSVPDF